MRTDAKTATATSVVLRFAGILELIIRWVGNAVAWLSLSMVLVTFLVVVLRYAFDTGSIALQESVTYMHAILFMVGAAYTLQRDGHVRVDIFYRKFSRPVRAWVDLIGTLVLLIPVCVFILTSSWHYVAKSWAIQEASREAGGIAGVYLVKTLLLVMPILLLVQGLVWVIRNSLFLLGVENALPQPEASSDGTGIQDSADD
jgi:TRAP-type mannitol/chloroaromatic compound transport system permease small subunit